MIEQLQMTHRMLIIQLDAMTDEARRQGCTPAELRDTTGAFVAVPVIVALANVEIALLGAGAEL